MRLRKASVLFVLVAVQGVVLSGCGGGGADEARPIGEVKSEAQGMDVSQLREKAASYKEAIGAKLQEAEKIKKMISEIPPMKLLGEEAKKLKNEVEAVTKSIKALKERFKVYHSRLKELKGDLSGLEL